jgi:hypothetical protein
LRPLKLEIPVTLDFGVAVHPQDGDQKSALLRLADQRLYQLKHAGRTSRVISLAPTVQEEVPPQTPSPARPSVAPPLGTPSQAERAAAVSAAGTPAQAERPPAASSIGTPPSATIPRRELRKWERVSLSGTKAYAVLSEAAQRTAGVIDLSYGGVALLFDRADDVPEQFSAVLHVPILPPVRVVLRKAYSQRLESGRTRVGCAFVS